MLRGTFGGRYGDTSGRPYLEGRLILPRIGIAGNISFLVDTGADASMIMPLDGKRLGIDYSQLQGDAVSFGLGGEIHSFLEDAILVFTEPGSALYLYNIEIDIPPPDPALPDDLPSLLGRDILDRWRMTYSPSRKNLTFKVFEADDIIHL